MACYNRRTMHTAGSTNLLPPILYGTAWKKDDTARLVHLALSTGFRGIDTACQPKHYNEAGVGLGIAQFLGAGTLTRSDLYIQTKFTSVDGQDPRRIPYDKKSSLADQVFQSCAVSCANLGVDVIDCLVLHSPLRTMKSTFDVWAAFEELVARGTVRTLGISNCYKLSLLSALYEHATVKPRVLQNRFYGDTGYDVSLRRYCDEAGITYQGFWTLTANPLVLRQQAVVDAAKRLNWTPSQTFLRCLTQLGIVPLVGTTSALHMSQDLAIFGDQLSRHEIEAIAEQLR
jgi:diketogulonate reductase-like aldo/keto reductase